MLKNKKIVIVMFGILVLSIYGIQKMDINSKLPIKSPQILRDLAYDFDKRLGYTIYIPENGKLEPYYVLTKNYYKQGNVLLMRKYVLNSAIPYKHEHSTSYYGNSLPDKFMNEVFIKEFPEKLQDEIPVTSINITDENSVMFRKHAELIKRQFFTLLEKELGKDYPVTSDEMKIKYFSEDRHIRSLGKLKTGDIVSWWLRGVDYHNRDNFAAIAKYNGYIEYAEVTSPIYIRPSFCLSPDTKIAKEKIADKEIYVLKDFQDLKLKPNILVEKIGLKYPKLQEYYVKYDYVGIDVEISNPQYGAYLSDNPVVPRGKMVVVRSLPYSDGQFEGWYSGDRLISQEPILTYRVDKNETLIVKFSHKILQ
ncbi:DUF6273 domain-containing protein [Pseudolactococcus reticulitermitis]|uniref:DUF6273 domain-containing protein n=1 Tax=Pseudolactococcus reticulitermitis TaxID=2025039 RepID=A0A224WZ49_9LACT|nr:DUF6273 domain-containing protein [Lactococcus reticulitermitis]GAX47347.1 hypothetical protein RsY01_947 [Lactococcus reticulitermitis]